MSKKFIIFGELSKKHLLPLFLALSYLAYLLINRFYPIYVKNNVMDLYCNSFGFAGIIIIPYIFKFTKNDIQNIQKEGEIQKNKYLHYFILIIVFILYTTAREIPGFLYPEPGKLSDSNDPFAYIGLEMICLTIVSVFLLKYKYYKHHILSIIGFVICGNACDLILEYYPHILDSGPTLIIIKIIAVIFDVIFFNVQKYMMEVLYYPYWRINLTLGITLFCATTIILIYVLIDKNSTVAFVVNFYKYFEYNAGLIIGKVFLSTITFMIFTTLCILNIYYFNPNYFIINFQLSKFVLTLIDNQNKKKFYCIIFFLLQTFFLLIYLEIIELNFLGLNENTKRNIEVRGLQDLSGENGRDSSIGVSRTIDINEDYSIISENNINEPFVEMKPKISEDI